MATLNERQRLQSLAAYWTGRGFACFFGLGAVAWAVFALPALWQQIPLNGIAADYVQGHTFPIRSLAEEAQQIKPLAQSPLCNPATLHDIVILRLAILEETATAEPLMGSTRAGLYEAARNSLSCAPADPLVWLTLFWLDVRDHGVRPDNLKYLQMSYAQGQNEGWISLWRNRLAVALFDRLPDDLKDDALDEFVKLVGTQRLYRQTAAIFADAAPFVQSRIGEHLKSLGSLPRQILVGVLRERGVDVVIPNATPSDLQPWDRTGPDLKLPDVELTRPR
jgi:hypothetical protein